MELQDMAGHLIRRLNRKSTGIFQARVRTAGFDLTPVQFAALTILAQSPGIDQSTLAQRVAYDRATIGGVLDRLEQRGLLERPVSRRDRRSRELRLTDEGCRVLREMSAVVRDLQPEILAGLDPAERTEFLRLARKATGPWHPRPAAPAD